MSDIPRDQEYDPYEAMASADEQRQLAGIGQEQIFQVPEPPEQTQQPQQQALPISGYAQAPAPGQLSPTEWGQKLLQNPGLPELRQIWAGQVQAAQAGKQAQQQPTVLLPDAPEVRFSAPEPIGTGGAWEQFKGGLQRNWADMAVGIPTIANAMGTPLPQGLSDTLNDWGKTFKSWSDENFASLSPEAKQAASSSFINSTVFGGKVDPTTGKVPTPDSVTEYTKGIFIDLASFIFALPIPAATASRVLLQGGARLAGMGAGAAATTGALGTATALIGGGAAQNVGSGRELLREEIFKTPDSELRKKDFYRTLREQGIPEAEAREQLVDKTLEVGQLALAGGIGMAAVSLIGPAMGLRGLTQRLTPTTRGGMAGLNAAEGVVGGGGQMGGTEFATQTGAISAGARDQYDPGRIALATGGGAAIGGALGGAAGYALGGHAPGRVDTPPKPDPVDPAQAAAIANSGKSPPIATTGGEPALNLTNRVVPPPGERYGPDRPSDQYGPTWPPPPPGDLYNQRPGYGVPPPPGPPNVPPRAPGGPPGYVDPTTVPRQPPPPPGPPTPRPVVPPPPPAGPAGYVDPTAPRNIPPDQRYPFGGGPRPIIPEPPAPLYQPGQPGAPTGRPVPTAPAPIYGPGQPGGPRPSRANVAASAEAPPPPPAAPTPRRPSEGLSRQDIIDRMIDEGIDPVLFNRPELQTHEAVARLFDGVVAQAQAHQARAAAPKGEEVLPPKTKAPVEVKGSRKVPKKATEKSAPAEKAKPTESATKQELTTEPDDVVDGQYVVKINKWVVGKGPTPEAAARDAEARNYNPYIPEELVGKSTAEVQARMATGAEQAPAPASTQGLLERAGAARAEFRPGAKAKVAPEIAGPTKHEFRPEAPDIHKLSRDEITQRLTDLGLPKSEIARINRKNIVASRAELAKLEADEAKNISKVTEQTAPAPVRQPTQQPTAPVVGLVRRETEQARREAEARKPKPSEPDIEEQIREDLGETVVQDYDAIIGKPAPVDQRTGAPRVTSTEWLTRPLDEQGNELGVIAHEAIDSGSVKISDAASQQNTYRNGRQLERDVILDDKLTPWQANLEYGQPAKTGRKRTFPTLVDYLNHELEQLRNKNNRDALVVKIAHQQQVAPNSAEAAALNIEHMRFGEEYIKKLQKMRDDILAGPPPDKTTVVRSSSINDNADTPLVRMMNHPDVVGPVHSLITQRGYQGVGAHEVLDLVSNNPFLNRNAPHVAAYARILKRMLPDDILFHSQEGADATYGALHPALAGSYISDRKLGEFIQTSQSWIHHADPQLIIKPHISMNIRISRRFVENILHESTHAVTQRFINRQMTSKDLAVFDLIRTELVEQGYAVADRLSQRHRKILDYTLTDNHELHTHLMTSPAMFEIISQIKPSNQFIRNMRSYGYDAYPAKSLWQVFTDTLRQWLNIPRNYKSLFEHVARPMQDIMDRADRYNVGGTDDLFPRPGLSTIRNAVQEGADIARNSSMLDDTIRQARDEGGVQARNLWESTKRGMTKAALQFAHKDQIVEYNKADWVSSIKLADGTDTTRNLIEVERDVGDRRAYRASTFLDKFMDDFEGHPGAASIAARTDDVTGKALLTASYNQADGSKTLAENTHNPDPNLYNEAKREYDALDPDQKQAYRDVLGLYQRIEPDRRKSEALGLARDLLPTGTEKDRALLADALGSKKNIEALLADIDNSDIARALGERWDTHRDTVRKIAQLTDTGWLDVYVPHRRPGNHTLTYTKPTRDASGAIVGAGERGMERFKTYSEAEARRRELIDLNYDLVSSVMDARTMPRSAVPHAAIIDQLGDEVSKRVLAAAKPDDAGAADRAAAAGEQAREALTRVMLGRMHSSITTRRAAREGVLGASPKMSENIPADVISLAHHVAGVEYGPLHRNILAEMRRFEKSQRSSGDQVGILRRERVISELEQRSKESEDIDVGMSNVLRMGQQATYVHSLISPSQMVINSAEMFTHAVPRIAARHKLIPTTMALTKATLDLLPVGVGRGISQTLASIRRDMMRADWDLSKVIRDRFIKKGMSEANADALINSFRQAGFLGHSQMRELRRMITPSGVRGVGTIRKWGDHFMNFTTILQHHVEIANRMAIGKAAFELELKRTGSKEQAAAYAVDIARKTGANPAPHNAPRIATEHGALGKWGAPIMQFRRYAMFAYGNLAVLIKDSFGRAVDATTKREARYALAGIVTTHTMAAGALTWLADPLRYLLGAYDLVTGSQTAHNYSANIRRFAANVTNPYIGELITRGGFRAIGWNVSGRMGMEDPAAIPKLRTGFYDARGWGEVAGSALTGAPGRTVTDFASAIGHLAQGNFQKFFERTVPRIIRDPLKAYREATQGVTDSQGRVIIPAKNIGLGESLNTAFGVQSAARANFWERRLSMQERRAEMQTSYNNTLRAAVDAMKGSPSERAGVSRLLKLHNDKYKDQPVNWDDVVKMQKRDRDRLRNPELAGLTVPRKAQAYVQGAGAF